MIGSALLAAPAVAAATISAPIGSADFIDSPTWEVVDFVSFVFDDDAPFDVLSPLAHEPDPDLGIAPGEPHGPPYDTELSDGLADIGVESREQFHAAEFDAAPTLIWFGFTIQPSLRFAPEGRTPDGELPMLPNELFPFEIEYQVQLDGVEVDLGVLPRDALPASFDVEGDSHLPLFVSFDPLLLGDSARVGDYSVRFAVRDGFGNGYDVESAFGIVDAPTPVWLVGLLSPWLLTRVRRSA